MIVFGALDDLDRRQLALALDLLARQLRTDGFPPPTATWRKVRNELSRTEEQRRTDRCNETYRPAIVDRVSSAIAAERLHVTPRAVVARLQRGTLSGIRLPDRRWLVDADQLPPLAPTTGTTGQPAHVTSAPAGRTLEPQGEHT